ncbi:MAG: hypothetical protein QOE83_461 [Actinomycetota bacterium]|nr:hypothetical protein [Actinomycetota bacterium]
MPAPTARDAIRAAFLERTGLQPAVHRWEGYGQPFELLHRGTARGIEHAVSGVIRDIPLWMFEYWYVEDTENIQGERPLISFDCIVVTIDAWCPPLLVEPRRGPLGTLPGGIAFESEEFNRTFRVKTADREYASAAVDARMMAWLLDHGRGMTFELLNDRAMAAGPQGGAKELDRVLEAGLALPGLVPRVLSSLYPHSGPLDVPPM